MTKKTKKNIKYRKLAYFLLAAGFIVLFFVVTPNEEASFLRHAGMAAAFVLFPASVYFNFKARNEGLFSIPRHQSIVILLAFLALVAGLVFLR